MIGYGRAVMPCQHRLLTTRWWPNIVQDVVSLQSCLTALMLQRLRERPRAATRRERWAEQRETAAGITLAIIFILFRSRFVFPIDQLLVLVSWGHWSQQSWWWMRRPWGVAGGTGLCSALGWGYWIWWQFQWCTGSAPLQTGWAHPTQVT